MAVCSYRGKLLVLMAIHLILLSVNRITPELTGSPHIFSDCLGSLEKIRNLPPHRIPSKCRHSYVLKNVMLHCSLLSFMQLFTHVSVHQDNWTKFENLPREAQLNCAVNFGAKRALLSVYANNLPWQQKFLLEAICVWVGREKMPLDMGHHIWYHAHRHLAWEEFVMAGVLYNTQFNLVKWQMGHNTLSTVSRMFQVLACKQVWSIGCPDQLRALAMEGNEPTLP